MANLDTTFDDYKPTGCGGVIALVILIGALIIGTCFALNSVLGRPLVAQALGVIEQEHAVEAHVEAVDIRTCLDENGPTMIWKHKRYPTWYLVCQLDDYTWGIQAVSEEGMEKTAFSPGNGSYGDLLRYLRSIAVRFKGVVPWIGG